MQNMFFSMLILHESRTCPNLADVAEKTGYDEPVAFMDSAVDRTVSL